MTDTNAMPNPATLSAGGWSRNEIAMLVPREEALAWGHVEPTQEEITAARDRIPARYAEQVIQWDTTRAFLAEVAAADLSPLARRVLQLHSRASDHAYAGCTECADGDGVGVEWPCDTARVVFQHAEIDVPDVLVFETPVLPIPDPDNPRWPYPAGPVRLMDYFPFVTLNRGSTFTFTDGPKEVLTDG